MRWRAMPQPVYRGGPMGAFGIGTGGFSPRKLFAQGEQGAWYDPSDLTTLFQDHQGTTPATIGQPVGLMLDKSRGLVRGPERVTNGDFNDGLSGWTQGSSTNAAVSNGIVDVFCTGAATGPTAIQHNIYGLRPNTSYEVTYRVRRGAGRSLLNLQFAGGGASRQVFQPNATPGGEFVSGKGVIVTNSTGSSVELTIYEGNATAPAGLAFQVDSVSVRELPGNHATQATVTARPTLGRVPRGGRRNLLRNTENFTHSGLWISAGIDTTPVEVLPGIMGVNVAEGQRSFRVYDRTNNAWIIPTTAWPIDSGRFSATFTAPAGCVEANLYLASGTPQIYSGAVNSVVVPGQTYTVSMHVHDGKVGGAQYELGPAMTPYQRVGSSDYDVTEDGVPSLNYLDFDGVDDTLVTVGNFPLSGATPSQHLLALDDDSTSIVDNAGYMLLGAGSNHTSRAMATNHAGHFKVDIGGSGGAAPTGPPNNYFILPGPAVYEARFGQAVSAAINGNAFVTVETPAQTVERPLTLGKGITTAHKNFKFFGGITLVGRFLSETERRKSLQTLAHNSGLIL